LTPDPGRTARREDIDENDPTITRGGEGAAIGGETDAVDAALVVFEVVEVVLEFGFFVFVQVEEPELRVGGRGEGGREGEWW
jgi:hypothetical protein